MNQAAFEADLKSAGYTHIETKVIEQRSVNEEHKHDYEIRGIVIDGTFIVTQDKRATIYRAGEVFIVAQGQPHTEEIGPQGARILLGRKY